MGSDEGARLRVTSGHDRSIPNLWALTTLVAPAMPDYVVLLRGVNVGKALRVPMATFKHLLEAEGFAGVRTLLNSGNAVGTHSARAADKLAQRVQAAILESLGLDVPVVVKPASEFNAAAAENPLADLPEAGHPQLLLAFVQDNAALQPLQALMPLVQPAESLHIGRHAAYLHCANGILQSQAALALLGKLGRGVTTRNWATVLKIRAALP